MRGQFVLDSDVLDSSDNGITVSMSVDTEDMVRVWITANGWRVGEASMYLPGLEGADTVAAVRVNYPEVVNHLVGRALEDARRTQAQMGMLEVLRP